LAVAPAESGVVDDGAIGGLRAAGVSREWCYIVSSGEVAGIIVISLPQSTEDGWLDGVAKHVAGI
jgi:hypothetical protein